MKPITATISNVCGAVGIGKTTCYKLIAEKQLEALKIGRRTLITVKSVDALIEQSIQKEGL